ncbi:glycosyltransferase family 2 protein [Williamsia serinedens]|uniref:Glycosyltransferase like family 2 n=1 Tax=Williamsia serinedens TaxID=391736 RepID=A0ABT1H133_9NOCA|nr:glycosyltransferase [Williamsia serinedens]MCP2160952.1 Glycosyltransferase like family 2 [Williamsia serinedens]
MTGRLPDGRWLLPDGRCVLPGNRWDLAPRDVDPPTVSVVVPFYEQQPQLELVLAALSVQTHPATRLQVVVADDGSSVPPDVGALEGTVVVRQEDRGFRAAAARNLGARAADGSVLCFLDADTVPEPTYVDRAVRLSAGAADVVAVGRRRHADLAGWSPSRLLEWFDGGAAPTELTEPRWLRDAYRESDDLLHADHRSYRHVISAVLTCERDFFWAVGGFDEGFVGYGGEDWEFAARAWERGGVLAHVAEAVAWHDGPDWAERSTSDRVGKNAEALALASRITDPAARRHGIRFALPDVRVVVDTDGHSAATLLVTVGAVLRDLDATIHLVGENAGALRASWGDADPRIVLGTPGTGARSRIVVHIRRPITAEPGALGDRVAELDDHRAGRLDVVAGDDVIVEIRSVRADARAQRHAAALACDAATLAEELFPVLRRDVATTALELLDEEPRLDW